MSATIPRIRIDLSRAELLILVEAIMCATSSERPGLAEASQMREIALRLQEALSETRPPDGIRLVRGSLPTSIKLRLAPGPTRA
jgi:hypothetical protein